MSSNQLPSAGVAVPYKPLATSEGIPVYSDYGSNIPLQTAVPLPPPPRQYYGTWRDEPVEIIHRDADADLYCSLFIVFFFFLSFILLIIVLSISYSDDDYYR